VKITVADFDEAAKRVARYVATGYRVTYSSMAKVVLQRLPKLDNTFPKEINIHVRSNPR